MKAFAGIRVGRALAGPFPLGARCFGSGLRPALHSLSSTLGLEALLLLPSCEAG